ncbi:PH domain-containing protein [Streptomyces sp. NPDC093225]|uniref:PH domain-containing protein n=1 Tax=Streptomyces sp. NPDC093225 TaxID=3366034 RepID=UPI00382DB9AC
MTNPPPSSAEPVYADRVYRSPQALVAGVLLLAIAAWLGGDALLRGSGWTPWFAAAGLLIAVPLIVAFTLRPAVFVNDDRIRVRNPFRLVTAPWAAVEYLRSGYSAELFAGGAKYQLWAIPVSLRERKRANRQAAGGRGSVLGRSGRDVGAGTEAVAAAGDQVRRATADRTVDELNELHERCADRPGAQGVVAVRWAYEILAPVAAGLVLLGVVAGVR